MSADKELIERLHHAAVYTRPIPSELLTEAAARLEALQPSPETSLQNMQTRGAVGREGEPVAWRMVQRDGSVLKTQDTPFHEGFAQMMAADCGCVVQPLYASPIREPEISKASIMAVLDEKIFLRALSQPELGAGFSEGYGVFGLEEAADAILALFSSSPTVEGWQPTRGFETVKDGDLVRFVEEGARGAVWEAVRPATAVDVLRLLHAEYMADEECRAEVLHHLIEEGCRFTSPTALPAHNTDASGPSEGGGDV